MPPIVPAYTWSQDADAVIISVPLKGTKAALVDLLVASTYVKVSFGRYLLELDLLRPVDDRAATATAKEGVLSVRLPKQREKEEEEEEEEDEREQGPWPTLTAPTPEDKASLRRRRTEAVAAHEAEEQRRAEEQREKKAELEQAAFRAQMAMQERVRREAAAREAEEKRQAAAEVLGGAARPAAMPTGSTNNKPRAPAPPTPPTPLPPPRILPPPRAMRQAVVRLQFTARAFPTPARESKAAEEEAWLARNGPSLPPAVPSSENENGGVTESHPVWLKARGDALFKAHDFEGALNAYDACLKADPTQEGALANRGACHLKLGRLDECVADCTAALSLCGEGEDKDRAKRLRLFTRRGCAYYQKGEVGKALEEYLTALQYAPPGGDAALLKDIERLRLNAAQQQQDAQQQQ